MKLLTLLSLLILSNLSYADEDEPFDPFKPEEAESNVVVLEKLATTYCTEALVYLAQDLNAKPELQKILTLEAKVYQDLCELDGKFKSFATLPAVDGVFVAYVRLQNSWARIAKTLEKETELESKYYYEIREDLLYQREKISPYSVDSEFYKFYSVTLTNLELFNYAQSLRLKAVKANESLRQE
jgi:hypothetical protein